MDIYLQGILSTLLFLDPVAILTGRPLYVKESVMHNTINLSKPRPVLWHTKPFVAG